MVKPSLLQTLLRQPSQSYSTPSSTYDPSSHSYRQSGSSVRSSSIRSASSLSLSSSRGEENSGQPWEWSVFGGRKGLTGGPASLRAFSAVGRAGEGEDDSRSVRSSKSLGSIRSTASRRKGELGNGGSWTRGDTELDQRASRKGKEKEGASRRYSELPPVPAKGSGLSGDQTSRRYSSALAGPPTSPLTISITSSSPSPSHPPSPDALVPPIRKTRKRRSVVEDTSAAPSLSSSVSSAASSTLATPISETAETFSTITPFPLIDRQDAEEEKPARVEKVRKSKRRALAPVEEVEEKEDERRRSMELPAARDAMQINETLARQDEEEDDVASPQSLFFDASEMRPPPATEAGQAATLPETSAAPPLSAATVPAEPITIVEDDIEQGGGTTLNKESISAETLAVLDRFPAPSAGLLDPGSQPTQEPSPSLVSSNSPPSDSNDDPPPSAATLTPLQAPLIVPGRVWSMDELFGSVATTSDSPPPMVDTTQLPRASSLPPAIPETPLLPLNDTALPSASSTSSNNSSLLSSTTDHSSPATDLTENRAYTRAEKGKGRATIEEEPTSRPMAVPRIMLARTDSDEARAGVKGDIELRGEDVEVEVEEVAPSAKLARSTSLTRSSSLTSETKARRRKSSSSTHSTSSTTLPTFEIVASSKLTSANLASSTSSSPSTAAQDTPQWLKNITALGQPIEPTFTPFVPPRRTKSATHKTVDKLRKEEPKLSPRSSLGNLRAAPVMEAMPEEQEVFFAGDRSTPSDTPQTSISGGMSAAGESTTIPRRRTHSATSSLASSPSLASDPTLSHTRTLSTSTVPDSLGLTPLDLPLASSRPRAMSLFSDATSAGGKSVSGLSTMSVPIGAYRPAKSPARFSMGAEKILQSSATMSALSVSANATAALGRSGGMSFRRSSKKVRSDLPPHLRRRFDAKRDLTFGMLQPPPTKLRSDEVLVEVLAVGLDQSDYERVCEMASKAEGFGWIPGRSFCGKALECGVDVSKIKRGDFVYGLQELKKSGAIAELLTTNRDLLSLAPACGISVEQIAALPLAGVSAVQVMESLCDDLPKGSKILVLNAHEGVGNLCMQLAFYFRVTRDIWMVAQCSPILPDGEAYCKATGASDVIVDEPLAAINCLHESSFDVVIDTIGGRRMYDASRRILHHEGQFITTVGDELGVPTPSSTWKSGIRSLRRSFFKKEKKALSYWAVNLDERENTRDALDKLRDAVERGGVRPAVRRVVGFAEAGSVFDVDMGAGRVVKMLES